MTEPTLAQTVVQLKDALQTARLVAACSALPTETRRLARLRVRRIRRALARANLNAL